MSLSKLDRSRPFGSVCGPAGHAYEQDGKNFDINGIEVVRPSLASTAGETSAAVPPDEGIYEGWKLPALKREVLARTGRKIQSGTERSKVVETLLALDKAGIVGDGTEPAGDDEGDGDNEENGGEGAEGAGAPEPVPGDATEPVVPAA